MLKWTHYQSPDAFDPVLAHVPTCLLQQNSDPSVAKLAILTSQCDDRLGKLLEECLDAFR